jgi:hypothetical protein
MLGDWPINCFVVLRPHAVSWLTGLWLSFNTKSSSRLVSGTMDVNVQFMSDTAERRRTQNRLAQRKFRGEGQLSNNLC